MARGIEVWKDITARVLRKKACKERDGCIASRLLRIANILEGMDRDNAYIFGAVCPARDCGVALVLPHSDTHTMNLYLATLGKAVTEDSHAVVIVDGADWHIADALLAPDNIGLLFLPPYSPELNAQENIWQYLRQNFLVGRTLKPVYKGGILVCRSRFF